MASLQLVGDLSYLVRIGRVAKETRTKVVHKNESQDFIIFLQII